MTLIMKLTPLAPAYYVLALSLIGLLLGFYLHRDLNSEAGSGEPIPTAKKPCTAAMPFT